MQNIKLFEEFGNLEVSDFIKELEQDVESLEILIEDELEENDFKSGVDVEFHYQVNKGVDLISVTLLKPFRMPPKLYNEIYTFNYIIKQDGFEFDGVEVDSDRHEGNPLEGNYMIVTGLDIKRISNIIKWKLIRFRNSISQLWNFEKDDWVKVKADGKFFNDRPNSSDRGWILGYQKKYQVLDTQINMIKVNNDKGIDDWYSSDRFIKLNKYEIESIDSKFLVGDVLKVYETHDIYRTTRNTKLDAGDYVIVVKQKYNNRCGPNEIFICFEYMDFWTDKKEIIFYDDFKDRFIKASESEKKSFYRRNAKLILELRKNKKI